MALKRVLVKAVVKAQFKEVILVARVLKSSEGLSESVADESHGCVAVPITDTQ
jgi:hypothetical protein